MKDPNTTAIETSEHLGLGRKSKKKKKKKKKKKES